MPPTGASFRRRSGMLRCSRSRSRRPSACARSRPLRRCCRCCEGRSRTTGRKSMTCASSRLRSGTSPRRTSLAASCGTQTTCGASPRAACGGATCTSATSRSRARRPPSLGRATTCEASSRACARSTPRRWWQSSSTSRAPSTGRSSRSSRTRSSSARSRTPPPSSTPDDPSPSRPSAAPAGVVPLRRVPLCRLRRPAPGGAELRPARGRLRAPQGPDPRGDGAAGLQAQDLVALLLGELRRQAALRVALVRADARLDVDRAAGVRAYTRCVGSCVPYIVSTSTKSLSER